MPQATLEGTPLEAVPAAEAFDELDFDPWCAKCGDRYAVIGVRLEENDGFTPACSACAMGAWLVAAGVAGDP